MTTLTTAGAVVVGLDGSAWSRGALTWATDQALAERRPLMLVHAGAHTERAVLDAARDQVVRRAPTVEVRRLLSSTAPGELLGDLSAEAALVVLGSRGRGPVRSRVLGSVGIRVIRHASCPVVVVRPGNPGLVRNGVLVGVDGARSRGALDFAFRQASLRGLPLTVLHTFVDSLVVGPVPAVPVLVPATAVAPMLLGDRDWAAEGERLLLAECLSGMQESCPDVGVRGELARGLPQRTILERAARMNVVVVGSHVGHAAGRPFGSVAAFMVEHATCPVAVVPGGAPRGR